MQLVNFKFIVRYQINDGGFMKNLIALSFLFLTFTAQASGGFASIGKDLRCHIELEGFSKFYSCHSEYGPSDKCHDFSSTVIAKVNIINGDLAQGLSGQLNVQSLEVLYESRNAEFDAALLAVAHNYDFSGFVSYKDKKIELTLKSSKWIKSEISDVDFSAGKKYAHKYLFATEDFSEENGLNVRAILFCRATTTHEED
jgi:hypothetical protein